MPQHAKVEPQTSSAEQVDRLKDHEPHHLPILCLVLAALSTACIAGCIVVIYTSEGRPLDAYISFAPVIRPTVLLPLLSSISSNIQKYLFVEGVAIVWWRAFSNGASLADLHYLWAQGKASGFKDTLKLLFQHRVVTYWLIAVFLFMTAVSIADGPLLQQAIRPVPRNSTIEYSEPSMGLKKVIDDGWTGSIDNTAPANLYGTSDLDETLRDWYKSTPLPYLGCADGTCSGSIVAAGIRVQDIQSESAWIDLTAPENHNATVFGISFNRIVDSSGNPVLLLKHSYQLFADEKCNASTVTETRTFRSAVVKYDVVSDGSDLRLNRTHWPEVLNDEASKGDLPGNASTPTGPLAGLEYFGYYYLRSLVQSTGRSDDGTFAIEPSVGLLANLFESNNRTLGANVTCSWRYTNATEAVIWHLNDVMFRMAWWSTNGTLPSDYPTWTNTRSVIVYEINPWTVWLAFALMLTCLIAITSLFWGFWELDRKVSLSPLETGRALAMALLTPPQGTTATDLKEILREIGERRAKIA